MVVKTDTCSYSGLRIYPGHGIFYVRADQKSFKFINRKSKSQFLQRLNPRKIAWTTLYRRMHKKGTLEESARKKARWRRPAAIILLGLAAQTLWRCGALCRQAARGGRVVGIGRAALAVVGELEAHAVGLLTQRLRDAGSRRPRALQAHCSQRTGC